MCPPPHGLTSAAPMSRSSGSHVFHRVLASVRRTPGAQHSEAEGEGGGTSITSGGYEIRRREEGTWKKRDGERARRANNKHHVDVGRTRVMFGFFFFPSLSLPSFLPAFLIQPPFLQTQTIATLCLCEGAGGRCLVSPHRPRRCIPLGASQPIGSRRGRAPRYSQVPKNASAIDLFPG